MSTVDYKPLANGVGASVESQAQYVIDLGAGGSLEHGYQNGVADPNQVNKTLRQSSMVSAAVATFISNLLLIDVLDDGDLPGLVTKLTAAITAAGLASSVSSTLIATQGGAVFQYSSVTSCLLKPHNGNVVVVNGAPLALPVAGCPLASSLLTDNTDYNVYLENFAGTVSGAANNGGGLVRLTVNSTTDLATGYPLTVSGVTGTTEANGSNWTITVVDATHIDLQGSVFVNAYVSGGVLSGPVCIGRTTSHTLGANGSEVMTGDATKALVGKVRLNGAAQFQQSAGKWYVRSWFNDPGFGVQALITGADVNFNNDAGFIEISSSARVLLLGWTGEIIEGKAIASFHDTTAAPTGLFVGAGINSTTVPTGLTGFNQTNTGLNKNAITGVGYGAMIEGLNTCYLLGKTTAGTANSKVVGSSASGLSLNSVGRQQ